eukprot:SAG31_NODE_12321_length_949_cov_1.881176_2_plen_144_part_00
MHKIHTTQVAKLLRGLPWPGEWKCRDMTDWPIQPNGYDCGVYAVLAARHRVLQPLVDRAYDASENHDIRTEPRYTEEHIPAMRRHIQAELWHGVAYQLPGEPDPAIPTGMLAGASRYSPYHSNTADLRRKSPGRHPCSSPMGH